jgi:hypothetical protein
MSSGRRSLHPITGGAAEAEQNDPPLVLDDLDEDDDDYMPDHGDTEEDEIEIEAEYEEMEDEDDDDDDEFVDVEEDDDDDDEDAQMSTAQAFFNRLLRAQFQGGGMAV